MSEKSIAAARAREAAKRRPVAPKPKSKKAKAVVESPEPVSE